MLAMRAEPSMSDQWMPTLRFPLGLEDFRRLPRHAAYQYGHLDGMAHIQPNSKHYHGILDLATRGGETDGVFADNAGFILAPFDRAQDEAALPGLFSAAFDGVQPFASLEEAARRLAAEDCLERCLSGGDGPLVREACFLARRGSNAEVAGAILITLIPGGDPCDDASFRWPDENPEDCLVERRGQPHLTWILVAPLWKRRGVGTALLDRSANALRRLGHATLWSTFLLGNDASALWHWRHGFRLAPYPRLGRYS